MATVVPIGEPVNDAERVAIAHLRDHLPNGYLIFHNFEIQRRDETFEVDIAVLAPHALYLVDVKGTRGLIDVYGAKWHPEGRTPFTSPLLKLRGHARSLKGLLTASQPGQRNLDGVFVDAVVLLSAPDAHLSDQGGRDAENVTTLRKAAAFFQNTHRIPARFDLNITALQGLIRKALVGAAQKRSGPVLLGDWQVIERLGGSDSFTEYRAVNTFAGIKGGTALLRVYQADPYLPDAQQRQQQKDRIANAFRALNRLPGHPLIAGAKNFFATEGEDRYVLVTDDVSGQALRIHIDKPRLSLTLDQKLRIARELFEALTFCHSHQVVHRNLSPSTILFGVDGHIRLTGFEHARAGTDRSLTIADQVVEEVDPAYVAPEAWREPANASPASDVFSAGVVLYELFTGQRAFTSITELFDRSATFQVNPSTLRSEIPSALDQWLQTLCTFDPDQRLSATAAGLALDSALQPLFSGTEAGSNDEPAAAQPETVPVAPIDWAQVPKGTLLAGKLEVQELIGRGSFSVVYKVVDTLGDVTRALKLILRDRHSTLERLKKEYKTLVRLPEHPHVVRVIDANVLPGEDGPPYILFEYVQGEDVADLIRDDRLDAEDVLLLYRQVAEGLVHLHREGLYHCDIKPHNLLWTVKGAKITDFNVSVRSEDNGHGGGSHRYLPPDLDLSETPSPSELADRDLYALGLTIYEALTGSYPWKGSAPPPGTPAPDPRDGPGGSDLVPELTVLVQKAIAPKRSERFASASELLEALQPITRARREPATETAGTLLGPDLAGSVQPNTNSFVSYLQSLYSQSRKTNAGTRGLNELGRLTYIPTLLDENLIPEVIAGKFKLVLITGNAGDGKTAFLQQLEVEAGTQAQLQSSDPLPNGRRFSTTGRTFITNYDGSQDEEERKNDDVLYEFFRPFSGTNPDAWPTDETRLIAINEGRLVDFLKTARDEFPALLAVVEESLRTGEDKHDIAVVNLNWRSVVASPISDDNSILERQLRALVKPKYWQACQSCDLKDKCYVHHNAQTFQDRTAAPQVIERLKTLYTLSHLRGRLHITIRDLRSALSFMLSSARDCTEIHSLYSEGKRELIAAGFYFNSWMAADTGTADRLLQLLKGVDVGSAADPRLDRGLDFISPAMDQSRFSFSGRGSYDHEVLSTLYETLPRDFTGKPSTSRAVAHRHFLSMARRRIYFERRDTSWSSMLPYRSAERMLAMMRGQRSTELALQDVLHAINRGEGLLEPTRLGNSLALQVRQVERGTVRSYRLYKSDQFKLSSKDSASQARFIEHMPEGLALQFKDGDQEAELLINLDIFEMLERLNRGYRPSIEEEQGYYLSLAVFKNILGSAPYQEVLLTTTGQDFYKIQRHHDGRLEMMHLPSRQEVSA
ncbi:MULTISPECIES: methylation-associated defense system protein kinase MAD6 [unclassified Cyanobium]|uniref:methylation-associated defense system protein kinase MAD6 n=1 Tax=unclassified Cyanobium TaxID=2627006 RepID=UPI0020CE498B|nr:MULTISPECIES: protein kinase [unclassified Cyanobium]MCP9857937.1 protein kinase [Cyanobium sp. Cruz-8H5]MCP9865006.1 protein kinase [Cyanobium sp. Cruz-8D1]